MEGTITPLLDDRLWLHHKLRHHPYSYIVMSYTWDTFLSLHYLSSIICNHCGMNVFSYTLYPSDIISFFASYAQFDNMFSSGIISFNNSSNCVKLLSVQLLITFKLNNLSMVDSRVKFLQFGYKGFLLSLRRVSCMCARWKESCPISRIISYRRSFISISNSSLRDAFGVSDNSSCHVHFV